MDADTASTLLGGLACPETSWSIGEYGALAEFHHVDEKSTPSYLSTMTDAGGIDIADRSFLALAYEAPSGRPGLWMHGIALCLLEKEAAMHRRATITALGVDSDAMREEDRHLPFFDLGLSLSNVDFCVRAQDPAVAMALGDAEGTCLLRNDKLFRYLQQASPHRVLMSKAGRIEVRTPIPAYGGHSPRGPHTHLLPGLLRTRRRYSATLPIPDGWVPCMFQYPPNPMYDASGNRRAFNRRYHDRFQSILKRHGHKPQLTAKAIVHDAIGRNVGPAPDQGARTRHDRLAARVAVRQLAAQGCDLPALSAWQDFVDKAHQGTASARATVPTPY